MLFGTTTFLFVFLPAVLALHLAAGPKLRNLFLLAASLLFYAWGEPEVVLVMLASILTNYAAGLLLERATTRGRAKAVVAVTVALNLLAFIIFKYANFLRDGLAQAVGALGGPADLIPALDPISLPIGISFFTFQALSYVVDVYRRETEVQRNPFHFGLYIALFPQLIAGPIVRYNEVAEQIHTRRISLPQFAEGVRRFIVGLAKKLLIADVVAVVADRVFDLPGGQLTTGIAWLGIVCYGLQIYFDFSGYSDMAIGLGSMLGFHFPENFRYPYISQSITEFWRRWHITLSTFFRDYLYIPLGGNRGSPLRTMRNLMLVFLLCGLWHGASWSFVVWGLYHGLFLIAERLGGARLLQAAPRPLRHIYAPLAITVGWVFFRAPTLSHALVFLGAMAGQGAGDGVAYSAAYFADPLLVTMMLVGIAGSMPIVPWLASRRAEASRALQPVFHGAGTLALLGLLLLCLVQMSAGTYSPFIYFRF